MGTGSVWLEENVEAWKVFPAPVFGAGPSLAGPSCSNPCTNHLAIRSPQPALLGVAFEVVWRLQTAPNAAARLLFEVNYYQHILGDFKRSASVTSLFPGPA